MSLLSHSFQQACCQVFNNNSTLATAKMDKNVLSTLNKVTYSIRLVIIITTVLIV